MTALLCRVCGRPLTTWIQPALMPGREARSYCDCRDPKCNLFMVTLAAEGYAGKDLSEYLKLKESK